MREGRFHFLTATLKHNFYKSGFQKFSGPQRLTGSFLAYPVYTHTH